MAMDVRVVTPITTWGFRDKSEFRALERPDLTISHIEIETGPASIECEYDEALAVPGTIAKIVEAERDGCDAVVIDCMGDPGMLPGRECVSIPVVGPCEAAMHVASMLGHTFSVVTVLKRLRPQFEHQAQIYGVREKLASVPFGLDPGAGSWSRTSNAPRRPLPKKRSARSRTTGPMRSSSVAPACWDAPRPCARGCSPGATTFP